MAARASGQSGLESGCSHVADARAASLVRPPNRLNDSTRLFPSLRHITTRSHCQRHHHCSTPILVQIAQSHKQSRPQPYNAQYSTHFGFRSPAWLSAASSSRAPARPLPQQSNGSLPSMSYSMGVQHPLPRFIRNIPQQAFTTTTGNLSQLASAQRQRQYAHLLAMSRFKTSFSGSKQGGQQRSRFRSPQVTITRLVPRPRSVASTSDPLFHAFASPLLAWQLSSALAPPSCFAQQAPLHKVALPTSWIARTTSSPSLCWRRVAPLRRGAAHLRQPRPTSKPSRARPGRGNGVGAAPSRPSSPAAFAPTTKPHFMMATQRDRPQQPHPHTESGRSLLFGTRLAVSIAFEEKRCSFD